jgi:hypothetical protein
LAGIGRISRGAGPDPLFLLLLHVRCNILNELRQQRGMKWKVAGFAG